MGSEPDAPAARRGEISQRIEAIHARIKELGAGQVSLDPSANLQRLATADRNAALSLAAAQAAVASSLLAFRRAADAHDHLAAIYEKAAAAKSGDAEMYRQRARVHRAAAVADRKRAEDAERLRPTAPTTPTAPAAPAAPGAPAAPAAPADPEEPGKQGK